MTPIYINGSFGVLHPARGRRGVLICGSMGDEAMNVYRPLALLADRFSAAGCPTLRLDYYGLGDSGGTDGEPGRFEAWLETIAAGVAWLRKACNVGPVTLVGVRIGAPIAARAACDIEGIESLILLAPSPSGRRFLRELILRARVNAEIWQTNDSVDDGAWFEAHGLRLDRATHDALDRLDIGKLPGCPAPQALVLDQRDSPAGNVVAERLRRQGTHVMSAAVDGLDMMLRDPYENAVPHAAFDSAVAWHAEAAGAAGTVVPPLRQQSGASATLRTNAAEETPVFFGSDKALFGILSVPAQRDARAPPVLIANTGANPRYSNSRNAVRLARWLADHGIVSLRMDGSGIGDSAMQTGERGQPYSGQADRDLGAAIDELHRRFPRPLLLVGMCSGAYHALRAAYDEPRIGGLLLVNLQKFAWHEGESLSVLQRTTFRTTRFYLSNLSSRAVWQRLVQGEVNIGGITRALAGRVVRRAVAASDPALGLLRAKESQVGRIRRQVRGLRDRKIPILFVLSGNDPGLDEIAEYFGARGRQFRRQPNVVFRVLEGADHTLSAHWARQSLLDMVAKFLHQHCHIPTGKDDPALPMPAEAALAHLEAVLRHPVAIDST
jgi:pimeloyl-ACP methyl ester carboxylesterase